MSNPGEAVTTQGTGGFVCPKCPTFKSFSQKSNLKRHMETVHSQKSMESRRNVKCDECGRKFASVSSRNKHFRLSHPTKLAPQPTTKKGKARALVIKSQRLTKRFFDVKDESDLVEQQTNSLSPLRSGFNKMYERVCVEKTQKITMVKQTDLEKNEIISMSRATPANSSKCF